MDIQGYIKGPEPPSLPRVTYEIDNSMVDFLLGTDWTGEDIMKYSYLFDTDELDIGKCRKIISVIEDLMDDHNFIKNEMTCECERLKRKKGIQVDVTENSITLTKIE